MRQRGRILKFLEEISKDIYIFALVLIPPIIVGMFAIIFQNGGYKILGVLLLWALSCFVSGSFIGFLFGIPKILQNEPISDTDDSEISYRQKVNTNLEQISDWLTKIIVGLGLINLKEAPAYLTRIAEILTAGIGEDKENSAFALSLIVCFTIIGFLFGYLFTRLFLAGAFFRADLLTAQNVMNRVNSIAKTIDDPKLLKQVLTKISPNDLVDGNRNETSEFEKVDTEPNEKDSITRELVRLNQEK